MPCVLLKNCLFLKCTVHISNLPQINTTVGSSSGYVRRNDYKSRYRNVLKLKIEFLLFRVIIYFFNQVERILKIKKKACYNLRASFCVHKWYLLASVRAILTPPNPYNTLLWRSIYFARNEQNDDRFMNTSRKIFDFVNLLNPPKSHATPRTTTNNCNY